LLDDVPGFVREMLLLPGRDVDLRALGIGQRVQLGGAGGVVAHLHVVQGQAREAFDAGLEGAGQARAARRAGSRAALHVGGLMGGAAGEEALHGAVAPGALHLEQRRLPGRRVGRVADGGVGEQRGGGRRGLRRLGRRGVRGGRGARFRGGAGGVMIDGHGGSLQE
jgi:hypothetical protein